MSARRTFSPDICVLSAAETPAPHLAIAGLHKRFGTFHALRGISLDVARGELLTLLGPSGCGKTTLLRIIAGFLAPDGGGLSLGGRSLVGIPPEARNFGMVFQSYAIFPHMTVAENVAYGLRPRRVGGAEAARRVEAALARVRLAPLAARLPEALSGGQKQRVGLARAMVIEPDLLLMDEPLSNLDAKLRIEMRQEIRLMQRELGITTIYVTHDQEEALAISDRIAVMDRGEVLQVAPPHTIFEDPSHAFVADFVGGCTWFDAAIDGEGTVTLQAGPRLAQACTKPPAAGPVRVALRGEDFRLAGPADDPAACLAGRVEMLSYLGHRTRLRLALDGALQTVEADLPSEAGLPAEGQPARLAFDPSRARVFAAGDGRRIG